MRLGAVPVEVGGEELLVSSTDGVSEFWRPLNFRKFRDEVVLTLLKVGLVCEALLAGSSGSSSSCMGGSRLPLSVSASSSSSSWEESGLCPSEVEESFVRPSEVGVLADDGSG